MLQTSYTSGAILQPSDVNAITSQVNANTAALTALDSVISTTSLAALNSTVGDGSRQLWHIGMLGGTGVAAQDVTSIVAAAMSAAIASGSPAAIMFPQGVFSITALPIYSLPQDCSLTFIGLGSGLTSLQFSGSGDGLSFAIPNPTSGYKPGALHIEGMTLRRTNVAQGGNAILLTGAVTSGQVSPLVTIEDVRLEGVGEWTTCVRIHRVSGVSLTRVKSEQYAIPQANGGDFVAIETGTDSSGFVAGITLTECQVIGGRYALDVGNYCQGVQLTACSFVTYIPVHWPSTVAGASEGFQSVNSYFDGVAAGIVLHQHGIANITGGQIQCFPLGALGALNTNFVALDLDNIGGLTVSSTVLTGMRGGLSGFTSKMMQLGATSGQSSVQIAFVGTAISAFDRVFSLLGSNLQCTLVGNTGLNVGTVGDINLFSFSLPISNFWNADDTGPIPWLTQGQASGTGISLLAGGGLQPNGGGVQLGTSNGKFSELHAGGIEADGVGNVSLGSGAALVNINLHTLGNGIGGSPQVVLQAVGGSAAGSDGLLTIYGSTGVIGKFAANGAAPSGRVAITGSRGSATAAVLESLIQAMAMFGLVTDNTTT